MKKMTLLMGILVLVIGMMLIGCSDETESVSNYFSVTVSGLESYNGKKINMGARLEKDSWLSYWPSVSEEVFIVSNGSVTVTDDISQNAKILGTGSDFYIDMWFGFEVDPSDPLFSGVYAKSTYKVLRGGSISLKYPDDFE